jgi:hypothetical protein
MDVGRVWRSTNAGVAAPGSFEGCRVVAAACGVAVGASRGAEVG